MISINPDNIEELIFYDKNVQKLLPRYKNFFDQWQMAQRIPGLQSLGKRTILELLNKLSNEDVEILETLFKDRIKVEKLDYNIVKNYKFSLDEIQNRICEIDQNGYMAISRGKDHVYICLWR